MGGKMRRQPIQRFVDQRVVPDGGPTRGKARQPGRALLIVDKQPVNLGSDHPSVG